jgi:putative toxin-antitoxin system antitoxin component (TIGR02293 family)
MVAVSNLAGVPLKTSLDEVRLTQHGIAPEAIELLKQLGASSSELHWIIKPRTLAHRKSKKEDLTQEETGRWLRAAKVQALALEVFGDKEKAFAWLQGHRRNFGNQSAQVLIQSEAGAQLVEDTLNQIDAGYFA